MKRILSPRKKGTVSIDAIKEAVASYPPKGVKAHKRAKPGCRNKTVKVSSYCRMTVSGNKWKVNLHAAQRELD